MSHLITRYAPSQADQFIAPERIFERPNAENNGLAFELMVSVAGFTLCVLTNLHNTVMHSKESFILTKVGAVILLDLSTLAVCPVALIESMLRLVLCIISLPILAFFTDYETVSTPFLTVALTLVHIPHAFYTIHEFTTSTQTVIA